jgi:hypothetical protein
VEEYRTDEDTLADFLSDHIKREPGSSVLHSEVFERYQVWSKTEGINFALSSRALPNAFGSVAFRTEKTAPDPAAGTAYRCDRRDETDETGYFPQTFLSTRVRESFGEKPHFHPFHP